MPKPRDLTGQTIGSLYVIGLAPRDLWPRVGGHKQWPLRSWSCRCVCGKIITVPTSNLTGPNTRSCGCSRKDHMRELGRKATSHVWERQCPQCRESFLGTAQQIYCSRECKAAHELVERHDWNCEVCGKSIKARRGQRWCSVKCKTRAQVAPPLSTGSILTATTKLTERGATDNDSHRQNA